MCCGGVTQELFVGVLRSAVFVAAKKKAATGAARSTNCTLTFDLSNARLNWTWKTDKGKKTLPLFNVFSELNYCGPLEKNLLNLLCDSFNGATALSLFLSHTTMSTHPTIEEEDGGG